MVGSRSARHKIPEKLMFKEECGRGEGNRGREGHMSGMCRKSQGATSLLGAHLGALGISLLFL